jgi:sugar phosphate isomerase/epimerase
LGITIAVENLPRTCLGNCSEDILQLLQADPRLKACYDTNHLLTENAIDFIRAVGEKIITVHVSDYDFHNEKHWLPYEGDINWVELVTALEEVGYTGPFMYEVASEPRPMNRRTRPTIDRPRPLTLKDVRENFEACVNKRPASPVGTRNEQECAHSADWANHK